MLDPESSSSGHEIESGTYERKKTNFIARRVIVRLAPTEDQERSLQTARDEFMAAEAEGAQVLREPGKTGRMVVLIPEGESVPKWCKKLAAAASVAYAEPDVVDRAQIVPNDTRYAQQWAPPLVNAEDAWSLETGQSNVVIGIIDSGISMSGGSLDHADLSTPGRFILGTDFVDGGTPRDQNGHGTHVTGIAAAAGNNAAGIAGMNWNSPVYVCRTLDAAGFGSAADFADAVEEITDYAVAHGLKAVINYSGGGSPSQTKLDACNYASDRGMLLVAATGNDNGGPVIYPAAYSTSVVGVVAVGSTDADDTVSSYSNVGPEVTVVAPGRNILSTLPTYTVNPALPTNYGVLSGTSMATPLVSGLAALMWSRHPSHTNQKVKQCLQDTAVELGSGTFNNSWGYGRVDALAALRCGDLVIPFTTVPAICPSPRTAIITCMPRTAICPTRVSGSCPSRLPILCPTTALRNCWSKLMCVQPVTALTVCDPKITTRICPSAVDACPSAPGGCPYNPGDVFDPRIRVLESRLAALETEMWAGSLEAGVDEDDGTEAQWFYVDDDGEVHEV